MKKSILILGVTLIVNMLNAQENIVKASLTFGNAGLQYERLLVNKLSIVGQAGFGFNIDNEANKNFLATGTAYKLGARYYFSSKKGNMQGWHIGPEYQKINTKAESPNSLNSAHLQNKYDINMYGIESGSQWIFDSNLSLEFVLGVNYSNYDKSKVYTQSTDTKNFNSIGVTAGVSLGYAF